MYAPHCKGKGGERQCQCAERNLMNGTFSGEFARNTLTVNLQLRNAAENLADVSPAEEINIKILDLKNKNQNHRHPRVLKSGIQ